MNRIPFKIRSVELAAALEVPKPPSARAIILASTALSPSWPLIEAGVIQARKRGMLARWKKRQQGATHKLNSGADYWEGGVG